MTDVRFPLQTTPFIGRVDEIVAIAQRLADPACPLLTLVGPGGIGKTRLAIEVAKTVTQTQPSVDSIHFVDLQPISSDDLLVTTIANSLGVLLSGADDPRAQLLRYLSDHEILLLLDNFEQLLDKVDLLADIIKTAPGIKLLVTSREALNIQEEWVWRVGGLQVPDSQSAANIEPYSAMQLFVERARRARQDFTLMGQETDVMGICQLVEGMPLALELAASWTKVLSCAEIADEIRRSLNFLTASMRNMPERHRSMQAVFDYSWRLLTDEERAVFPKLSVFRGGFRREAAEQVAGASLVILAGLMDKSFVRMSASGRYEIHELMRQYGEEYINAAPGAKEELQNRHCVYYADFLYQRQLPLRGSEQAAALDEIGDELDNVRVSWLWAAEHDMREQIHHSMHSLYLFCHIRAQAVVGEPLFNVAVKRFELEDSATLAYLLLARTWLAWFNGRSIGVDQYPRAIQLATTFWTDDEIAILLAIYGPISKELISNGLFDEQRQEQLFQDFLEIFRAHDQLWGEAIVLYCLGQMSHYAKGQVEAAEQYQRASLDGFLRLGDRWGSAWSAMGLADVLETLGRYPESLQMWHEHQDICAEVGDPGGVIYALANKARVSWKSKDYHAAKLYTVQAIKSHLEKGSQFSQLDEVFRSLIEMFISENRHERAAELVSFLRQQADRVRAPGIRITASEILESLAQKLPPDTFQQAIERGKKLHLRTILEQLLDELSDYAPSSPPTYLPDTLTERELEVLRLVAAGRSNRQIANDLVLTLNTVKSHVHHIYGKLGVESRTQAIARARAQRIL